MVAAAGGGEGVPAHPDAAALRAPAARQAVDAARHPGPLRAQRAPAHEGLVVPSGGGGSTSPSARGKGRRALAVLGGGKDVVAAASGGGKLHADGTAGGGNNKAAARRPPCMRSNSFYARAVAECLEFIKGSNSNAGGGGGATPARDNRVK